MTTAPRSNQILDQNNIPVPGANVYVYDLYGNLASLTSDGTTTIANPLTTDQFGNYSYYATVNYYNENIWFGGQLRWVNSNVAVGQPGADLTLRADLAAGNATVNSNGTVNITPAAGTNVGLAVTQTYTGTHSGFNGNYIEVVDDSDVVGTNFSIPFYIQHNFGGSGATGGRSGIWIDAKNTYGATSGSNTNRNYSAITAQGWAANGDGGTGLTSTTAKGAFFGIGAVGIANSGATNVLNITAAEFNTSVQAGSSVALKSIIQLSGQSNDAVSGAVVDAMVWCYDQGGASGHNDGILFDASTTFGNQWPIKSGGNIIRTNGGTVANGIDISASTISGNAFKSPGCAIDGNGSPTFTPPASSTPAANGEMTFELTNNTTLKIHVKGSDGTVRSTTLTLS